jgi:hypothetical protein
MNVFATVSPAVKVYPAKTPSALRKLSSILTFAPFAALRETIRPDLFFLIALRH